MSNYVRIKVHKVCDESGSKFCVNNPEIDYARRRILGIEWVAEKTNGFEKMVVQLPDKVHPLFLNDNAGKPYKPGEIPLLSILAGKQIRLRFNSRMEGDGEVPIDYVILCYVSGEFKPMNAHTCSVIDGQNGGVDIIAPPRIIVRNVNPV